MKAFIIFLLLQSLPSIATAESQTASLNANTEEIIISGRRPGPPLWRLENGENTLWVFAIVSPMPKSFEWESSSIDYIISESEEYIPAPSRTLSLSIFNPIKAIGALRKFKKVQRIPNKQTLADILPAEDYKKFQRLKELYARKSKKIEKLTPLFAVLDLYDGAKRKHSLIETHKISRTIDKAAKKNKLKITKIKVNEKVDTKKFFATITGLSDATHLNCLRKGLDSLDGDIDALVQRATLWADGDADALVVSDQARSKVSCLEELMQNEQMSK